MTTRIAVAFATAALLSAAVVPASRAAEDGKGLFEAKCTKCHSVTAAGVASQKDKPKGGDLSKVGGKHDAQWIADVLAKKADTEKGKKHAVAFKGTPEQAKAIADWLATQK